MRLYAQQLLLFKFRNPDCRSELPDSRHKPEGKEVFIRRIQKRGTVVML